MILHFSPFLFIFEKNKIDIHQLFFQKKKNKKGRKWQYIPKYNDVSV